jgi:hypothetical protein
VTSLRRSIHDAVASRDVPAARTLKVPSSKAHHNCECLTKFRSDEAQVHRSVCCAQHERFRQGERRSPKRPVLKPQTPFQMPVPLHVLTARCKRSCASTTSSSAPTPATTFCAPSPGAA